MLSFFALDVLLARLAWDESAGRIMREDGDSEDGDSDTDDTPAFKGLSNARSG